MRCSGCGSTTRFAGEVCPYCGRDKSSDQSATIATTIGVLVGGFIGNLVGGFGGMIVGGLVLGVVAVIAAAAASRKNHSAKKPPRVRVQGVAKSKPASAPLPAASSVEDRLRRIDRLKSEGLLSDDEYQAQRRAIIAML